MASLTVYYHEKTCTTAEYKPIEMVFEVTGNLTPYTPAFISGPPEDCYPAEGGTFEITSVEPLHYYLAGERQEDDMGRYRELTGLPNAAWRSMIDEDECTELALALYEHERERDISERAERE